MNFIPASNTSIILFWVLIIILMTIMISKLKNITGAPKWIGVYISLNIFYSLMAVSGFLRELPFPLMPIMLALTLFLILTFSFSKTATEIVSTTSLKNLVLFQSFRFPLELILHNWFETGTIPETMTWSGYNYDILAGILALAAFKLVEKSKTLAWIVQIAGFALLVNVMRVAIMSSPLPIAWDITPKLWVLAYFPYCLIVPVFVTPAFAMHLLTFRKLLALK